ncbi:MAG TPA: hypothetical protein VNK95_08010, partial [Caldilineaceae bacterium]|nr:hypothetical protein [Caldilineaceae bacterium]
MPRQCFLSCFLGRFLGFFLITALLILAGLLAAPAGTAQAASPECLAAVQNDVWQGAFNISYVISEQYEAPDGLHTGESTQTGGIALTFGERQGDEHSATWNLIEAGGSGTIYSRYVRQTSFGTKEKVIQGEGAPVHFLGQMHMDTATCTYSLEVWLYLNTTWTETGEAPREHMADLAIFWLYDQPVEQLDPSAVALAEAQAPNKAPTLRGNLSIKAPLNPSGEKQTQFFPGVSAGDTVNLMRQKQRPDLGAAGLAWSLEPNPQRPYIATIVLEHPRVPDEKWIPLGQSGTVDGNWVLITANVYNPTNTSFTNMPVRFFESFERLPNCPESTPLPPKMLTPVRCIWDTEGWAWEDGGPGQPGRQNWDIQVKVELGSEQDLLDRVIYPLFVRPKPVILVHGENSNFSVWRSYPGFLHDAHDWWVARPILGLKTGESPYPWRQQQSSTMTANAETLHEQVQIARVAENAWHVDIVAHGAGGVIARRYIHSFMPNDTPDGRPVVKNLVMLGTPNQGTDCARLQLSMALRYNLPNWIAPLELTPPAMASFNQEVTNGKGTQFSVLVGDKHGYDCAFPWTQPSDDVVLVDSARYIYGNVGYSNSRHGEMPGSLDDFKNFVLYSLAVGRKSGQGALAAAATPAEDPAPMPAPQPVMSQFLSQTVGAGATVELSFVLPQAEAAAVTLVTSPTVASTLLAPDGQLVQEVTAGSAETQGWWRMLLADPARPGSWTLRLTNTGSEAQPALAFVQTVGGPVTLQAAMSLPDPQGQVTVTVPLFHTGAPVDGAVATLRLAHQDGTIQDVVLGDD